jgi:hypothetical protein
VGKIICLSEPFYGEASYDFCHYIKARKSFSDGTA